MPARAMQRATTPATRKASSHGVDVHAEVEREIVRCTLVRDRKQTPGTDDGQCSPSRTAAAPMPTVTHGSGPNVHQKSV